MMQRRKFLQTTAAVGAAASGLALAGRASASVTGGSSPRVVIVGGGYAGATAAKYIRMWSEQRVQVTLVEPNPQFVSCPISNLVLNGIKTIDDVTQSYEHLVQRHGVQLVRDSVVAIDAEQRKVRLAGGSELAYDRLVVSPGIDVLWDTLPGMQSAEAQSQVMHAWKAGAQTVTLRQQLEAMPNGGVFAITIPLVPYRCPPGPYERASVVADYFKREKPKSKVLILDANEDVTSKGALFKKAWADRYAGTLEYRPSHALIDVDVATRTLKFDFNDDVKADVLNVIPNMRAGNIAVHAGLATANNRWCEVDFLTFESKALPRVHVLGDSIQVAPAMPKSGHMANQHGKTCAAAIVALLLDKEVNPLPIYNNTCYSFVSSKDVVHVASVHAYDAEKQTMLAVPGSGGVSKEANALEGHYALGWANNIWADTLG